MIIFVYQKEGPQGPSDGFKLTIKILYGSLRKMVAVALVTSEIIEHERRAAMLLYLMSPPRHAHGPSVVLIIIKNK